MQKLDHRFGVTNKGLNSGKQLFELSSSHADLQRSESRGRVSHVSRRQFSNDAPHSQFPKQTAPAKKQAKLCFSAIESVICKFIPTSRTGESPAYKGRFPRGRITELEKRQHLNGGFCWKITLNPPNYNLPTGHY